jgi:DNA-binding PadR family transcriptional regulator
MEMKLPSPMEMQLLALVAHEERSGREVAELYRQETGKSISYGTLYTTFRRLKDSGWVKVRDDHDQDGRIRFFLIDIEGRRALAASRAHHAELATFGIPARGAI